MQAREHLAAEVVENGCSALQFCDLRGQRWRLRVASLPHNKRVERNRQPAYFSEDAPLP